MTKLYISLGSQFEFDFTGGANLSCRLLNYHASLLHQLEFVSWLESWQTFVGARSAPERVTHGALSAPCDRLTLVDALNKLFFRYVRSEYKLSYWFSLRPQLQLAQARTLVEQL